MLTPHKLDQIRKSMDEALSSVADKHNAQFKIGKMTYTNYTFRTTIECAVVEPGNIADLAKIDWDRYCSQFGFTSEDYGEPFESDSGKHFIISGIKPRSTKYPILGKCAEDGKEYKFQSSYIKRLLQAGAAE